MPYRCVNCTATYEDYSSEVLNGCTNCRGKFFFYIKKEKLKDLATNKPLELSNEEKKQIEQDVRDIAGVDEEKPVFLDVESIKIMKPGKYLIDIQKLFEVGKPRIYQLEDGKYIVDLIGRTSI